MSSKSEFSKFISRMFARRIVIIGVVGAVFFLLVAILAPIISPYDPSEMDLMGKLSGLSSAHPLGTDMYGRDLLSRIIYGTRVSLVIGVLSVIISAAIGTFLGMVAAYNGGVIDAILMRFCDAFRAIPQIALSMALIAIYGSSLFSMAVIIGVSTVPAYIRMMRASTLSITGSDYVLAAKLSGEPVLLIMYRHILPNSVSPIIIMATQQIGSSILMEAGLSFLGIGIRVPTASWGSMVNEARPYLLNHPLYVLAPCICIALLVISLNLLGDGIRDALDPTLRGVNK